MCLRVFHSGGSIIKAAESSNIIIYIVDKVVMINADLFKHFIHVYQKSP